MSFTTYSRSNLTRTICVALVCAFLITATPVSANNTTQPREELRAALSALKASLERYQQASLGSVLGASTITVSNDSELLNALVAVKGGETILLNPGTYSSIYIRGDKYGQVKVGTQVIKKAIKPTTAVTITSADKNDKAVIKSIALVSTQNWRLDTLSLRPDPKVVAIEVRSDKIAIINNDITYGSDNNWSKETWNNNTGMAINVASGQNVEVERNYMQNVRFGISIGHDAPNAIVRNNTVDTFNADAIRALGDNGLYEHNIVKNALQTDANHSDAFQSFRNYSNNKPVEGVIVRNNSFINIISHQFGAEMQGIGMFDGPFKAWTIENNLIVTDSYHGITVLGGVDFVIRNNVVVDTNTVKPGPVWISMTKTKTGINSVNSRIENNITTKLLTGSAGVTYSNNKQITYAEYGTYFVDHKNGNWNIKSGVLSFAVGATQSGVATTPVTTPTTPTTPTPTTPVVTPPTTPTIPTTPVVTTPTTPTTPVVTTPKPTNPKPTTPVVTPPKDPVVPVTPAAPTKTITITKRVSVYDAPEGKVLGSQSVGSVGTYKIGVASLKNGIKWIYVDFATGKDGYIKQTTLVDTTKEIVPVVSVPAPEKVETSSKKSITLANNANVRSTAYGTIVGTQPVGAKGTVDSAVTPIEKGGYRWVSVDFATGIDGYVATTLFTPTSGIDTTPTFSRAETDAKIADLMKQIAALQELLKTP